MKSLVYVQEVLTSPAAMVPKLFVLLGTSPMVDAVEEEVPFPEATAEKAFSQLLETPEWQEECSLFGDYTV